MAYRFSTSNLISRSFFIAVNYAGVPTNSVYNSDDLTDYEVSVKGYFALPTNRVSFSNGPFPATFLVYFWPFSRKQ